jgi:hypothetical protein
LPASDNELMEQSVHTKNLTAIAVLAASLSFAAPAGAGPVFLTGHDPDFHAQGSPGAQVLLTTALNFVTGNTTFSAGHKFLYVQSNISPPGGFLDGTNGLNDIGLVNGTNYDQVDAAGLAALSSFSGYSAIVVASSFGAMLTKAEINELIVLEPQIDAFVNAGGGLAAFAECGPGYANCNANNVDASTNLFGFVPVGVTSVDTTAPYSVTAYGSSLGLSDIDMNDPTHNSFGAIGGLNIVDKDANGVPTTLAGVVTIGGGGFHPVPEPMTLLLFGAGAAAALRRRRKSAKAG